MQMREMMFPLKKQLSLLCFVWQFNLFTGTNFYPKFCPLSCLHNITITQYHNNTTSNWETLQNIQNSNPTTGSVRPRYCERKLTPFFFGKTGRRNILLVKHFHFCVYMVTTPMDKLLGILFHVDCSIFDWRLQDTNDWDIVPAFQSNLTTWPDQQQLVDMPTSR